MRKLQATCFVLLAVLACGESCFSYGMQSQEESHPVAHEFREFNPAEVVEAKVPLDFFYNELLMLPNAEAYVIFYRGKRRSSWQDHVYAKKYLDNRGGLPPERIKAIFGGYLRMPQWSYGLCQREQKHQRRRRPTSRRKEEGGER